MLKNFAAVSLAITLLACGHSKNITTQNSPGNALHLYESLPDNEEKKTLRGIISPEQVTQDTAFGWYAENLRFFKADSATVQSLRAKAPKLHVVIFGGTWCHDTQQILPKYLTLLNAANFPQDQLSLIGTDRDKTTVGGLHKAFGIVNVPTLILMQDGKEVGRIVEYGSTGLPDKELAALVAKVP